MVRPSGDSRTTPQRSPVARAMCSATRPNRASIWGTASLKAPAASAIAASRSVPAAGVESCFTRGTGELYWRTPGIEPASGGSGHLGVPAAPYGPPNAVPDPLRTGLAQVIDPADGRQQAEPE